MTDRVDQPSQNPTRKLTAATLGAAAVAVSGLIVRNLAPEWYDADVWSLMLPVVVFALGYIVKDRDNSGLSPLAREVGKTVDAELPAGEAVEIVTPGNSPNIVIEAKP